MHRAISLNDYYNMFYVRDENSDFSFLKNDTLKTLFVHSGLLELNLNINNKTKTLLFNKEEGVIIAPHVEFSIIRNEGEFFAVESIENKKEILEIVDTDGVRREENINFYKVIKNPKKVNKPWGYEIWISWFKNHHVLKKIYMTEGNKCSLQYHEEKSETNYIISGKANVLKDIQLDNKITEQNALKKFNEIKNINNNMVMMSVGDFWDNKPYEIHRVYSIESYTAYEASTPELDDVIRLQDDNNRISGFIKSEHI